MGPPSGSRSRTAPRRRWSPTRRPGSPRSRPRAAPPRAGGEPQPDGAGGNKGEVERKRAVVLVLARREVLPHPVVLELQGELVVGDALLEREAPPEDLSRGGDRVEPIDPLADKEVVLLLAELLANVHRLVLENGAVLSHPSLPSGTFHPPADPHYPGS